MNKLKLSLVVVLSLTLVACGGSSSRGSANWGWGGISPGDPNNPGEPNNPGGGGQKPTDPSNPGNPDPGKPNPSKKGKNLVELERDEFNNIIQGNTGTEITLVDKDGNEFHHTIRGRSGDTTENHKNNNLQLRVLHHVDDLDHSIYGVFGSNPEDVKAHTWEGFAGGVITPEGNMPLTGTATYTGKAKGFLDKSNGTFGERGIGNANIEVNFGTAKVDGIITSTNGKGFGDGVQLKADIRGSNFVGEANRINHTDKGDLYGQFNGPNAEEMSGYYNSYNPNGMTGSFGAKAKK